ncbi:hypothetical protein [Thermus filiformis]|uniref:Uncharacterized protein n=1 Tax=Thermus filiformis TaxID=276 RepID=A0A0D6XBU6_THEFI|nr:hypothetical protein [Thermus filiformis]KIX84801.1 hypothetical protein THFILI_00800 [Thermus filiformis]
MQGARGSFWKSGRLLLALALAFPFLGERPLAQKESAGKALQGLLAQEGLPAWDRPASPSFPLPFRLAEPPKPPPRPGVHTPLVPPSPRTPPRPAGRLFLLYRHLLLEGG